MKRATSIATIVTSLLFLLVIQTPADAVERLSVFADAAMADCSLDDYEAGIKTVYVGHETSGASSVQFRVQTPECWAGATFVASTPAAGFSAVGDAPDGMIVSYGQCWGGPFIVATIDYYSAGEGTECCWIYLEKAPSAPLDGIISVDCAFEPHVVTWSFPVLINENGTCRCSNPVRTSTWGAIKALYSD